MEEKRDQSDYQKELFERLKKSSSLKKAEESFGALIKPAFWWIIDNGNPALEDIEEIMSINATHFNESSPKKTSECLMHLLEAARKSSKLNKLLSFNCDKTLKGFVYPIIQGDKIYGYIGACYSDDSVSEDALKIFPSYIDTIIGDAVEHEENGVSVR